MYTFQCQTKFLRINILPFRNEKQKMLCQTVFYCLKQDTESHQGLCLEVAPSLYMRNSILTELLCSQGFPEVLSCYAAARKSQIAPQPSTQLNELCVVEDPRLTLIKAALCLLLMIMSSVKGRQLLEVKLFSGF